MVRIVCLVFLFSVTSAAANIVQVDVHFDPERAYGHNIYTICPSPDPYDCRNRTLSTDPVSGYIVFDDMVGTPESRVITEFYPGPPIESGNLDTAYDPEGNLFFNQLLGLIVGSFRAGYCPYDYTEICMWFFDGDSYFHTAGDDTGDRISVEGTYDIAAIPIPPAFLLFLTPLLPLLGRNRYRNTPDSA